MIRYALIAALLSACASTPQPNPAGLTVTGSEGVPVFSWTGDRQEKLDLIQWDGSFFDVLWSLVPSGGPPVCVNNMASPVTLGELPMGMEEAVYGSGDGSPPDSLPAGQRYEISIGRCVDGQDGNKTYEYAYMGFAVEEDGSFTLDCKRYTCDEG